MTQSENIPIRKARDAHRLKTNGIYVCGLSGLGCTPAEMRCNDCNMMCISLLSAIHTDLVNIFGKM